MTRIQKKFAELALQKRKAFIPFITAGDPDLATTEKLIYALDECGVSIIELGVPFSDPMADGPVIQKANERALKTGVTLAKILDLVARVRLKTQVPILLMGYYNPLLQYGLNDFAGDAAKAGVDALLIVDLPPEEAGPLRSVLQDKPIDIIYLLAPTSDQTRIKLAAKHGSGFVYFVSITGITGAKTMDPKEVARYVKPVKKGVDLPVAIGFGISRPEHVAALSPLADGVVVGSFLVNLIAENSSSPELINIVKRYIKSMMV